MSDSSICISSKIVDCGGGRTGILGGRTGNGILRGRKGILASTLMVSRGQLLMTLKNV